MNIADTKAKLGPGDRTIVLKRSTAGETQGVGLVIFGRNAVFHIIEVGLMIFGIFAVLHKVLKVTRGVVPDIVDSEPVIPSDDPFFYSLFFLFENLDPQVWGIISITITSNTYTFPKVNCLLCYSQNTGDLLLAHNPECFSYFSLRQAT